MGTALPGPQLGQGKGYQMLTPWLCDEPRRITVFCHHGSDSSSREGSYPGEASRRAPGNHLDTGGTGREGWTKKTFLPSGEMAARAGRCPLKDKKCPWQILGEILKGSGHGDQSLSIFHPLFGGLMIYSRGPHLGGEATECDGSRLWTHLRVTSRGAEHPDSGVPGLWVRGHQGYNDAATTRAIPASECLD